MGRETSIEWADSSCNAQMGCQGCELWNPKAGIRICYAGILTARHAGKPGWPASFEEPALFPHRLAEALRWPDLTGTERPAKPWLNGLPRVIFLDDMGDTFTEGLPLDWLAPHLPAMAASPHVWMVLTKRPRRMRQFFAAHPCPPNVWPGTSITDQPTANLRLRELMKIDARVLWVSAEPLLGPISIGDEIWPLCRATKEEHDAHHGTGMWCEERGLSLVIAGGESGPRARPMNLAWLGSLKEQCAFAGIPYFLKQLGARPVTDRYPPEEGYHGSFGTNGDGWYLALRDRKGGTESEWPSDLQGCRAFPEVRA